MHSRPINQRGARPKWEVDHIVPCSSFELNNPMNSAGVYYTNLQPLWWRDNLAKKDRLDWHPMQKKVARALAKLTFD